MPIKRETIDLIRERAQIQDIVKRYVPTLQKKGRNFLGLCPFHKEKTPSFTVSPDKQIFYCFGCQTGGNVFTFIQKMERLDFPESVRHLGDILGIRIEEEVSARAESGDIEREKKINRIALKHFREILKSDAGSLAREYLERRGLTPQSMEDFSLGYVPDEWDSLYRRLTAMKAPLELAEKLGLLSSKEKEGRVRVYDRFRNRIMFPIFNHKGEVIAFGGRVTDQGEPKYLNSPESELFHKGSVLYGFERAQESIRSLNRAIVVEGYLDVIGCHQAGITNVVAPLGTALTQGHVRFMSRYCHEIIMLFDADSAGIKASLRSLDVAREQNVEVRVAELQSDDPFDFVIKKGPRELMAVIDTARMPVDFLLERAIIAGQGKGRMELLLSLFDILKGVEFESERSGYFHTLAERLKIREDALRADYKKFTAKALRPENSALLKTDRQAGTPAADYLTRSHREMVLLLCRHPELINQAIIDFSPGDIPDPIAREIYRRLAELFEAEESISIDRIIDYFTDGEVKLFLEKHLFVEYNLQNPGAAYTEIYINVKLYQIDQKIDRYVNLIKAGDPARVDSKEYLTELEILRREKEKLSHYVYNKSV